MWGPVADVLRQVRSSPFGTFLYNPTEDRYQFDEQAKRLLGELAKPGVGFSDILERMPEVVQQAYEEWRADAIENGPSGRVRLPFRLPGREAILEVQVQRSGQAVQGIIADVTRSERDYQELLNQLLAMNAAEGVARFGVWAYDIEEDHLTVSKGAADLLLAGTPSSGVTLERVLELVHEDDRAALREAYAVTLRTGEVQHVEFRRADEPNRWFVIQFMRTVDDGAEPVQLYGMVHETTYLRHREELEARHQELLSTQELRSRFVNAAAHELSQPMTPLRLQFAMLRRRISDREDVQKGLNVIERNLERVGFILSDLLDAARSQAGHLRVDPQPVNLVDQVSHVGTRWPEWRRSGA